MSKRGARASQFLATKSLGFWRGYFHVSISRAAAVYTMKIVSQESNAGVLTLKEKLLLTVNEMLQTDDNKARQESYAEIIDKGEEKKSLVMTVNEMLRAADDEARRDFANGVTYESPGDKRLERIYEHENGRVDQKETRSLDSGQSSKSSISRSIKLSLKKMLSIKKIKKEPSLALYPEVERALYGGEKKKLVEFDESLGSHEDETHRTSNQSTPLRELERALYSEKELGGDGDESAGSTTELEMTLYPEAESSLFGEEMALYPEVESSLFGEEKKKPIEREESFGSDEDELPLREMERSLYGLADDSKAEVDDSKAEASIDNRSLDSQSSKSSVTGSMAMTLKKMLSIKKIKKEPSLALYPEVERSLYGEEKKMPLKKMLSIKKIRKEPSLALYPEVERSLYGEEKKKLAESDESFGSDEDEILDTPLREMERTLYGLVDESKAEVKLEQELTNLDNEIKNKKAARLAIAKERLESVLAEVTSPIDSTGKLVCLIIFTVLAVTWIRTRGEVPAYNHDITLKQAQAFTVVLKQAPGYFTARTIATSSAIGLAVLAMKNGWSYSE